MIEILKKIRVLKKGTKAQFVCSLTIQWPDGKKISEIGKIKGNLMNSSSLYFAKKLIRFPYLVIVIKSTSKLTR